MSLVALLMATECIPLDKIIPQQQVDELCGAFRDLDTHLASPRYDLPKSFQTYSKEEKGKRLWMFMKYFRNIAALDKLESVIETLDPFWVGIEYFQQKITLTRAYSDFPKEFVDRFFISIIADSLRSSLDIFSKYLGWYFSLDGKESLGFGYKTLVAPLQNVSMPLSKRCNSLLKSPEYELIKEYRDADKHIGQGKHKISFEKTQKGFVISTKRPEPLNISELQMAALSLFFQLKELVFVSVQELKKWPLGYDSPDEPLLEETPEGTFRMPKKA